MRSPVFSIVLATYNRQNLLPRAIESVLNQTFDDFELIVVDNGSTDNTRHVVEGIKDTRIHYMPNPRPTKSCDVPRNIGIRTAKGQFISFLDDDDIWYPERLGKVKNAFDDHPEVSCVCHDENRVTSGKPDGVLQYGPWAEDLYERLIYDGNRFSPCATTVKAGLLYRLNGFDEREELSEVADYDLWIRMAREGTRVYFIREPLGEFHLTGSNWSTVNPKFGAKQAVMISSYILGYEKKPLFQISRAGLWRLFRLYCVAGRSFVKTRRYAEALPYFFMAILFMARRPVLITDLYAKARGVADGG